jgi:hypothetical protein
MFYPRADISPSPLPPANMSKAALKLSVLSSSYMLGSMTGAFIKLLISRSLSTVPALMENLLDSVLLICELGRSS